MSKWISYFTVCLCLVEVFAIGNSNRIFAQKKAEDNALQWRLIGRVFMDGGFFMNDTSSLGNAFMVNDLRLGTVVKIYDDWEAKIELGYGNGKVSLKDVYLGYSWKGHVFRLGHQYEPFGYARVGSANYRFMSNDVADRVLGNSRKWGLSYSYDRQYWNVMAGVYSDGDIQSSVKFDQGYVLTAKVIGRPLVDDGRLIHIAVAPRFSDSEDEVSFSGGVPTDLLTSSANNWLDATVDRVKNQWKMDLECIMLYDKWYFQGQYYLVHLNRCCVNDFNGQGGYAQAGYLLLGEKHNYNQVTGMMGNPAPGSLELLVRYGNADLNNASICGGRLSEVTVGMNYFVNKYIAGKINYTRMMVGKTSPRGGDNFDLIQARLQFNF